MGTWITPVSNIIDIIYAIIYNVILRGGDDNKDDIGESARQSTF